MKKIVKYSISIIVIMAVIAAFLFFILSDYRSDAELNKTYTLQEDNQLIVYTSHKPEVYEPVIKEFEERTGIWVEVVSGGTTEMLERIAKEDGKDSGDVMFGGGVDSLEAYSDYFISYKTSQSELFDTAYRSNKNKWTAFSKLPIVFIYNNKLVYPAGTPRSWSELLNSRWKGKIAFAAPGKSGTSYTALSTMIQVLSSSTEENPIGEDEIISTFIDNLEGSVSDSSGDVLDDVISGTKLVGVTLEEAALKRIAAGEDLDMVYPREGTSAVPDGTAILKNAPHERNAQLFLDFTVSEDVQQLLVDKCCRRPVRTDIIQPEQIEEVTYNLTWSSEHQKEILDKWTALLP